MHKILLKVWHKVHYHKTSGKNVGIPKMKITPCVGHTLLNIESQLQFPEALFRDLRQVFWLRPRFCRLPERLGFQWHSGRRLAITAAGTVRDSHSIPYWVREGHHKSTAKVRFFPLSPYEMMNYYLGFSLKNWKKRYGTNGFFWKMSTFVRS